MIYTAIARDLGLPTSFVRKVAISAHHRYKVYFIPKRRGGRRRICHPARELKLLQRWLVGEILSNLPVHESALGYRERVSTSHIARKHSGSRYYLRMDFANFFESIRARDIRILLKRDWAEVSRGFPKADIDRIAQIVCKDEALTVGAPSSPVLSNAVLSPLDSDIHGVCVELGCAYSRYADDLFFSSNAVGVLGRVEELVTEMVEALKSPDLTLNAAKTVHTSKKHRVRVLGLILTPTGDVSIGRAKKREIKALVYRFTQDEIDTETYAYLRGYLAYLYAAEPSFIDALKKKYSVEAVDKLLRAHEV